MCVRIFSSFLGKTFYHIMLVLRAGYPLYTAQKHLPPTKLDLFSNYIVVDGNLYLFIIKRKFWFLKYFCLCLLRCAMLNKKEKD